MVRKKVKKTVKKALKRTVKKTIRKGRPKKVIKYTKTINVRFTHSQWVQVISWAEKAKLEPSVYMRKIILDFLNIQ